MGELAASDTSVKANAQSQVNPSTREARRGASHGATILSKLSPPVPTEVYDTYWRFAAERQEVFFRRAAGQQPPWTSDPVVQQFKFTNAYRAADRVSQYLIRYVIYQGDSTAEEVFFRTVLFKLFNRTETWELLQRELGPIGWAGYEFGRYDRVLSAAMNAGERIYSPAYIMPPPSGFGHARKHQNHLKLLELMMRDAVPQLIGDLKTMRHAFELLRSYPSIGNFLAYQLVTDLNYGDLTAFSETEFVIPGPGARDGIRKCFKSLGGLSEPDLIRFATEQQAAEFERLGIQFRSLWGRPLQLIDCQNLFCEVDKYARVAHPNAVGRSGRTRIKQKYTRTLKPIRYWFPPKWGINDQVRAIPGGPP